MTAFSIIKLIHIVSVILFLLLYFIKTILLLSNKEDVLKKFTAVTKVPEMVISVLFLFTGGYLLAQVPSINNLLIIKIGMVLASIPMAVIGFKKRNKILAALSLLMITASYGLAEMSAKKGNNVSVSANADASELYSAKCASCHGPDGKLRAAGAANLATTQLDVSQIKNAMLNGIGMMSPVQLSEEQADAIANYVSTDIKGK